MILVDSSVWIDFFRGDRNGGSGVLARCLGDSSVEVGMADLVLFEVLRGFRESRAMHEAEQLMRALPQVDIGGAEQAVRAAALYRRLRMQGRTVRSAVDVLLASHCMTQGHVLLHRDADFEQFKNVGDLETWPH
ncbi:type II toxin-antitoxin system VapC family toxin [Thiomonas sp.]